MTWQDELRALHRDIWQSNRDPKGFNWSTEARELTPDEWHRVKAILAEHKPVCQLRNASMGFGCAIDIYEPPSFPGLPVQGIASITGNHLPAVLQTGKERRFETGWREFSPFTHSDANAALLAHFEMDPPREKYHYDY